MFGQIGRTPYDLEFTLFGIPIRVHPVFWLTSAYLGWVPGALDRVAVHVLCIFTAILVHEMGHALMTRKFGWRSEIVLYFFGGYATSMRHSTWKDVAVSAAGPAFGFMLYFSLWFLVRFLLRHDIMVHHLVLDAIDFSLFINFIWNVVNLLPVLPLDGGQISRELCCWLRPRDGMEISLKLSMLVSASVALWALKCYVNGQAILGLEPVFLALMFGYLCYQSYQTYQSRRTGYWS